MKTPFPFAAALLFAVLLATASHGADLLLPKEKSVLAGDTVLVLGKARPGEKVPVRLTAGGKAQEGAATAAADGVLKFSLPLQDGLNRVEVAGRSVEVFAAKGGASAPAGFRPQRVHAGDVSKCGDCHEPSMAVRQGGYPGVCTNCHIVSAQNSAFKGAIEDDRHFRASGRRCGRCHDPHGANDAQLLVDGSTQLCGQCHGVQTGTKDLHAAFDEGGCVACHDPHFSGYPSQLVRPLTEVCGSCHSEVLDQGHGSDLEECATCHDPHGTQGKALARGSFAERCGECHDGVGQEKHPHPALEEGCEACHDPHSAKKGAMLQGPVAAVCGECHDQAQADTGQVRHEAADACTDCHGAHGGENDKYLVARGDALCLECHDDPREGRATVHAALEEGCLACHDPHAGSPGGILVRAQKQVCLDCHDDPSERAGHPATGADTRCSSCHDPHGADQPQLLRADAFTSAAPGAKGGGRTSSVQ